MDQYDTFLSHNRDDKPEAKKLALRLQDKGGLNPWLDAWHIPVGVPWDKETQKALSACGSCTVLLGAHGWGKYHLREVRLALTRREEHPDFLIVPVILPGASEEDMELFNELHWIDFRAGVDDEEAMIRLTAALKGTPPFPEGRPRLSFLITMDARRWEWSGRKDISILYRGNQLQQALAYKALSPLVGEFLDASLALEKQQEASRKRRRCWIIATPCLLVIILYLWISTRYYLSTSGTLVTSRIVVRHGHPGLKVLPGFDFSAVSTNYSIYDLNDSSVVADERLGGFWFQRHDGYSKWGEQLYSQLHNSAAGLAYWRVGDREEGIARLASGVSSGDKESIRILGYIAMQDDTAVGPAVDAIIIGLQGVDELHAEALTALAVIRDTQPEASAVKFAEMAVSISGADEAQAVALAEAVSMLGSATQQALSELFGILRTTENAQVKLAVARALGDIILRNPEAFSAILPDIAKAISENQGEISHAFLASLATSAQLDLDSLELALETTASSLEDEDADTRVAATQAFGELLMKYPAISGDYYSPKLLSLLSDPSEWVRKAALELLPSLPTVSQKLADAAALAALEDVSEVVRYTAMDALTSPHALVLMSRDISGRIRQKAIYKLAEISLGQPLEGGDVESVLFDFLGDTSPAMGLAAAQALLLISDQIEADLTPAFEILVAYLLPNDWGSEEWMLSRLAGASPGSAAIIIQGLSQYFPQDDDSALQSILDFIVAVGVSQPSAAKDVVLVSADLLSERGLVKELLSRIARLRHLPSEFLTEALDALVVKMESSLESERESAAVAMGLLWIDDEVLASTKADALGSLFSDPSSAVRAQAAISLGIMNRNHPVAIGPYLPELLACLVEEEADVRRACAESLADISEHDNALTVEMVSHLVAALSDTDADVRRYVAYALANTDEQAPAEAEGLLSELMLSADDAQEQLICAYALGVIAGDDPDTADQVIALIETFVSADDISFAQKTILVLGALGEKHPEQVEKVVGVLAPLVSASDYAIRRYAIYALRNIGVSAEMSAEIALKAIEPGLYHTDETTRSYALSTGIQTISRFQPSSAESALPILLEYWSSEGLRDKDLRFVSSSFWTALDGVYTILGSDDLNILWPLISSRSRGERSAGRKAVLRIIIQKPEVIPDVRAQLEPYKNDSRPYARQSAAVADEMIQIVLRTEENLLSPERWREILRWLPSVGVDEAKEYSLQQIADLYGGG